MLIFALMVVLQSAPMSAADQETLVQLNQATDAVLDSQEALAFSLGRCSAAYPSGQADPYVVEARQALDGLGSRDLSMAAERVYLVRFSEGTEAAPTYKATVRECASEIGDAATELRQQVQGMRGLLTVISQRE